MMFHNALEIFRQMCALKLRNGDVAVDCTMGNGRDTVFLCRLVGEKGRVFAFDIQEQAVSNTRRKLAESDLLARAILILDGHQNLEYYVQERVGVVVFNLGYLPGGNHNLTTEKDTTLKAVRKSLEILKPGGLVLLVVYPGHEEGRREKEALDSMTSALDQKEFAVGQVCFTNQVNDPPELLWIERTDRL